MKRPPPWLVLCVLLIILLPLLIATARFLNSGFAEEPSRAEGAVQLLLENVSYGSIGLLLLLDPDMLLNAIARMLHLERSGRPTTARWLRLLGAFLVIVALVSSYYLVRDGR